MLVLRCGPVPLPSKGKEDGALLTHRDEHFHLGVAGVGKLLVERRDGLGGGGGRLRCCESLVWFGGQGNGEKTRDATGKYLEGKHWGGCAM